MNFNIGGGYTFALSEVREHLGDGYNVNFGLTYNVTPVVGLQAEYSYNGLGEKQVSIPGADQPLFGDMNMQYGTFNLVFKPSMDGRAKRTWWPGSACTTGRSRSRRQERGTCRPTAARGGITAIRAAWCRWTQDGG